MTLNIGGHCFQTSPSLYLMKEECPFRPARNVYFFFNWDPAHFKFILNYLPNGAHIDVSLLPREKNFSNSSQKPGFTSERDLRRLLLYVFNKCAIRMSFKFAL